MVISWQVSITVTRETHSERISHALNTTISKKRLEYSAVTSAIKAKVSKGIPDKIICKSINHLRRLVWPGESTQSCCWRLPLFSAPCLPAAAGHLQGGDRERVFTQGGRKGKCRGLLVLDKQGTFLKDGTPLFGSIGSPCKL